MPADKKPFSFDDQLRDELREVARSRGKRTCRACEAPNPGEDPLQAAHRTQPVGLSLSGGGIRSATFNLGVMQALAEMRLLHWFDYLSTVSGGGYIGSWLVANAKRYLSAAAAVEGPDGKEKPPQAQSLIEHAEEKLAYDRMRRAEAAPEAPLPAEMKIDPVQFLRRFSNYLTPQIGLFSADTWTAFSIYLRNLILNQPILILTITSILLVPRLVGLLWRWASAFGPDARFAPLQVAALISLVCLSTAVFHVRRAQLALAAGGKRAPAKLTQRAVQVWIVIPVMTAAAAGSLALWLYCSSRNGAEYDAGWRAGFVCIAAFTLLLYAGGRASNVLACFAVDEPWRRLRAESRIFVAALAPALVGGYLVHAAGELFAQWDRVNGPWTVAAFGTPLAVALFSFVLVLHMGILGIRLKDWRREWWSRVGAWLFIYTVGWAVLFGVAIYGPLVLALPYQWLTGLGSAWVMQTAGAVLAGRNADTGTPRANRGLEILARVGPPLFIAGLFVGLSTAIELLLPRLFGQPLGELLVSQMPGASLTVVTGLHYAVLGAVPAIEVVIALLVCVVLVLLLAATVDVNEFSMHHFYRNRLVRCYLGSSHRREPDPFTGLDVEDDILLKTLRVDQSYLGPLPILNTTLNLVHGKNLAWQQRKGASFTFTPLYCGYEIPRLEGNGGNGTAAAPFRFQAPAAPPDGECSRLVPQARVPSIRGYRPTAVFAYPEGPSLGTAMAVSGAAVSPNWGYHSSPTTAFLLTLFNARLGWWVGNPARGKFRRAAPVFGFFYFVKELLGLTDQDADYVYLSDGGHFENLGIYELVRRRCRFIVASDAGQDPEFSFDDLGNAIRKIRTDLGISIDIDLERIRPSDGGKSHWHCAVGQIHYDDADQGAGHGLLVYLKSSLTGDEPADVRNYAAANPGFPHQSTTDQWFDEAQFESYRALGHHVAMNVFEAIASDFQALDERAFVALRQQWYPPAVASRGAVTRLTGALNDILATIRRDPDLRFLDEQIYPEWLSLLDCAEEETVPHLWLPAEPQQRRKGFYCCNAMIQLMENVYLDLNLEGEHEHPDNRGWMNLFRHWSWSGMFRITWSIAAGTYGARFQTFCRRHLDLTVGSAECEAVGLGDLNFHEQRILSLLEVPGATIYRLRLRVGSPNESADFVEMPFGFAAAVNQRVVFFRVEDHVRKMGLARSGLRYMVRNNQASGFDCGALRAFRRKRAGEYPDPRTAPSEWSELMESSREEAMAAFDAMLRSVASEITHMQEQAARVGRSD